MDFKKIRDVTVKLDHKEVADIKLYVKELASQHGSFKEKHDEWVNFISYGVDQRKPVKSDPFDHRKVVIMSRSSQRSWRSMRSLTRGEIR